MELPRRTSFPQKTLPFVLFNCISNPTVLIMSRVRDMFKRTMEVVFFYSISSYSPPDVRYCAGSHCVCVCVW